jgi:hypothetical protein
MSDDTVVSVGLTVAEWNQVLAQLSEGQFRLVAPLIGKIRDQAMKALSPPAAAAPPANGPSQEEAEHGLAH